MLERLCSEARAEQCNSLHVDSRSELGDNVPSPGEEFSKHSPQPPTSVRVSAMSAKKSPNGKRVATRLNDSLDKNLQTYVDAASAHRAERFDKNLRYGAAVTAVGMGMLAFPTPAHAKIVYTPAHVVLRLSSYTPLDLNHDGIDDFSLVMRAGNRGSALYVGPPSPNGNAVVGTDFYASALHAGVRVGGGKAGPPKLGHSYIMAAKDLKCASTSCRSFVSTFRGPWENGGKGVKMRYLGLKFMIKGKIHYGWARLNVGPDNVQGVLTGYAYETIPNKPIVTGKTQGPDEISRVAQPVPTTFAAPASSQASLGQLAQGSPSLAAWRREIK